jgi:hypothetical protein
MPERANTASDECTIPDSNPGTRLSPCGQRRRKVFSSSFVMMILLS